MFWHPKVPNMNSTIVKSALKHLKIIFTDDLFKLQGGQWNYMSVVSKSEGEHRHLAGEEESQS